MRTLFWISVASLLAAAVACTASDPASEGGPGPSPTAVPSPGGNDGGMPVPNPMPDAGTSDGSSDGGSDGMTEPEVVFTGDFTIVNGIDLQTIQPYTRIAGTLFIKPSGGLTEVSLPNLRVVDGLFRFEPATTLSPFTKLDVPSLKTAGGLYISDRLSTLTTFSLPKLERINSFMMRGYGGSTITTLSFPLLAGPMSGTIDIDCYNIADISGLSRITSASGVAIHRTALEDFSGLVGLKGTLIVLDVQGNPRLKNTDGLAGITRLDPKANAYPRFVDNPELVRIALNGVTTLAAERLYVINNPKLTTLAFPALTSATWFDIRECTAGVSIDVPVLTTIDKIHYDNAEPSIFLAAALTSANELQILDAARLNVVKVPKLVTVGLLNVQYAPLFTGFDAPVLATTTNQILAFRTGQQTLSFPALKTAKKIAFHQNAAMTGFDLPALTEAQYLELDFNASLAIAGAPVLTKVGGLQITRNVNLIDLAFPALTTVASGDISANTKLKPCVVAALSAQVGKNLSQGGNNGAGTCP